MLVKDSAAEELKRIISTLDKILLDRSRFENALYDCFDKPLDVYSLMAGYGYFAALPKKPKVDVAAAAIAKKSKISKDEAKLVSEIWISARFAGVKDSESTEVVKNKSPQPLAAPVRSSQALKQDAARKKTSKKVTEETAATVFADEEEKGIDAPEAASHEITQKKTTGRMKFSKQQKDPKVFYAGKTASHDMRESGKRTFFEAVHYAITGHDDIERRYYSNAKIVLICLLLSLGFAAILTASYFVFKGSAQPIGMLSFAFGYLILFLFWYAALARVFCAKPALLGAAVLTPVSALVLLGVYAASAGVVNAFLPEYAYTGWFVALFAILSVTGEAVVLSRTKNAKSVLLFAALSVPVAVFVMLAFIAVSSRLSNLSYAIENEPFWMAVLLAVLILPILLLLSSFYKKSGYGHVVCYFLAFPLLMILTQFVCFGLFRSIARVEWYWSLASGIALLITGIAIFRRELHRSVWYGLLYTFGLHAASLLLLAGLFALAASICGDNLLLLAGILAFVLTAGAQLGLWFCFKKLPAHFSAPRRAEKNKPASGEKPSAEGKAKK